MSTTKEFLAYVLEHMADWPEFRNRAMMGEYVVYWRDKVVGGIYDNRLLLKDCPAARRLMPEARLELPYPGAKEMLLLEELEPANREDTRRLLEAMYEELPAPKPKKPKKPKK